MVKKKMIAFFDASAGQLQKHFMDFNSFLQLQKVFIFATLTHMTNFAYWMEKNHLATLKRLTI